MSKLLKLKTEMKDLASVEEALRLMGVPAEDIEREEHGVHYAYSGRSTQDVPLIIRKKEYGGYGDLGFRTVDGTVEVLIDDLDDRNALPRKYAPEAESFTARTTQWYAASRAKEAMRKKGLRGMTIKEQDKQLVIVGHTYAG